MRSSAGFTCRPQGVKPERESVVVFKLAPRNDVPAWECWVEWIRPDGLAEATRYVGRLEDLESHVTLQNQLHDYAGLENT
jgi:hypothetical protein